MEIYIYGFLTAFTITLMGMPSIIKLAKQKKLYDEPDERKLHKEPIPALGGIGIFAGMFLSLSFWLPQTLYGEFKFVFCSLLIIFFLGVRDDLIPLASGKKFLGQLLAASIVVIYSDIKIPHLYGFLGIYAINYWIGMLLTIFIVLAIVNGFNLIDGINGLSGSLTVLTTIVLGVWFAILDVQQYALFAFTTTGAVVAFLKYNFTPAKIFMGDTGSMLVGLICAVLTLKLLVFYKQGLAFPKVVVVILGILILPLFDMLRVFIGRLLKKKSPFHPDRTHIHHLLIDYGFSHTKATLLLVLFNIGFILLALFLQNYVRTFVALGLMFGFALGLVSILQYGISSKKQQKLTAVEKDTILKEVNNV